MTTITVETHKDFGDFTRIISLLDTAFELAGGHREQTKIDEHGNVEITANVTSIDVLSSQFARVCKQNGGNHLRLRHINSGVLRLES